MAQAEEDAPHIGVEHPVVDIRRLGFDRCSALLVAGVVEGGIQRPNRLRVRATRFSTEDSSQTSVATNRLSAPASRRRQRPLRPLPRDDRQSRRRRHPTRHLQCRRFADAGSATRDQADFARHSLGFIHPRALPQPSWKRPGYANYLTESTILPLIGQSSDLRRAGTLIRNCEFSFTGALPQVRLRL